MIVSGLAALITACLDAGKGLITQADDTGYLGIGDTWVDLIPLGYRHLS